MAPKRITLDVAAEEQARLDAQKLVAPSGLKRDKKSEERNAWLAYARHAVHKHFTFEDAWVSQVDGRYHALVAFRTSPWSLLGDPYFEATCKAYHLRKADVK